MKFLWFAGFMLLVQQVQPSESISINRNGIPLAMVDRSHFSMDIPGIPFMDQDKYNDFITKLERQVFEPPANARLGPAGAIIPEKTGYKLDKERFFDEWQKYYYAGGPSVLEVPVTPLYPRVDSELLAQIKVQRIGQYVTYFNPANKERSHNIKLAAQAIDNHVLFPNEIFSFNKVVGKRTVEKGYQPAPIIVRGELSEGIGGGICQVSSTLFNAVDNAGVEILKRFSHSMRVPYVPPGRDATVSWYGPDFHFRNNYTQPILIRAFSHSGRMIVNVYSAENINYKPRDIPSASSGDPSSEE